MVWGISYRPKHGKEKPSWLSVRKHISVNVTHESYHNIIQSSLEQLRRSEILSVEISLLAAPVMWRKPFCYHNSKGDSERQIQQIWQKVEWDYNNRNRHLWECTESGVRVEIREWRLCVPSKGTTGHFKEQRKHKEKQTSAWVIDHSLHHTSKLPVSGAVGEGISRDEQLPSHLTERWDQFRGVQSCHSATRWPFRDSSSSSSSAVAYVQAQNKEGEVVTTFMASKSKVSPRKKMTKLGTYGCTDWTKVRE